MTHQGMPFEIPQSRVNLLSNSDVRVRGALKGGNFVFKKSRRADPSAQDYGVRRRGGRLENI